MNIKFCPRYTDCPGCCRDEVSDLEVQAGYYTGLGITFWVMEIAIPSQEGLDLYF
jgi:hypothetical protein